MGRRRQHKYRAKSQVIDGIRFASQKEAKRYGELKLLEKAGKIEDLTLQTAFTFPINGEDMRYGKSPTGRQGRKVTYKCDFDYVDAETGARIIEDTKGFKTAEYKLKHALMLAVHGIEILET